MLGTINVYVTLSVRVLCERECAAWNGDSVRTSIHEGVVFKFHIKC